MFLLTLNNANANECKEIYYAKTLEGNREVKICSIDKTVIYRFGLINSAPELIFSTLKKDILYDQGPIYDGNDHINIFSIFIPNGNVWYGLMAVPNLDSYNVLTVSRGVNLNYTNYYSKSETLMSYMLDPSTIINNLPFSEFTQIEDENYEENN